MPGAPAHASGSIWHTGVCAGARWVKQGDFEPSGSNRNRCWEPGWRCSSAEGSVPVLVPVAAVADSDSLPVVSRQFW